MNIDSVNDCELFSLLHPDIYHSFFDDGVYESTAPLLELPISAVGCILGISLRNQLREDTGAV